MGTVPAARYKELMVQSRSPHCMRGEGGREGRRGSEGKRRKGETEMKAERDFHFQLPASSSYAHPLNIPTPPQQRQQPSNKASFGTLHTQTTNHRGKKLKSKRGSRNFPELSDQLNLKGRSGYFPSTRTSDMITKFKDPDDSAAI